MSTNRPYTRRQFLLGSSRPVAHLLQRDDDAERARSERLRQAARHLSDAVPLARADFRRPTFHFRPPARWMGCPTAPILHRGRYHVFYLHNPFESTWGPLYWGHARSIDLVKWEHLPIALLPDHGAGETHCFSGSARYDERGRPVFVYTSGAHVGARGDRRRPAEQWMAIGSSDLRTLSQAPHSPLIRPPASATPGHMRDPFLFEASGRTFLLAAARSGQESHLLLYEALDRNLDRWTYRGVLFSQSVDRVPFFDTPRLAPLGDRWMLLFGPHDRMRVLTGRFDPNTGEFTPEQESILDQGCSDEPHFYGADLLFDQRQRLILLGRIRGTPPSPAWNGCLALPRIVRAGSDGRPVQEPAPELRKLRGTYHGSAGLRLCNATQALERVSGEAVEIIADVETEPGSCWTLRRRYVNGSSESLVGCDDGAITVAGQRIVDPGGESTDTLRIQVFVDRSVVEVFVNDGRMVATQILDMPAGSTGLEITSYGTSFFSRLDVWNIESIWADEGQVSS